jgi:hypothetical protein
MFGSFHRGVAVAAATLAAAALAGTAGVARADPQPDCKDRFALGSRLLTGPRGADLTVRITSTATACVAPVALDRIEVRRTEERRVRRDDVAAPGGVATIAAGEIPRGERVDVRVKFRSGERSEEYDLRGTTTALMRPDLVATLSAPRQILAGRAFAVQIDVSERNGDVGATAQLGLSAGGAEVGKRTVEVEAGGTVSEAFRVTLRTAGSLPLVATVADVDPGETTTADNDDESTIEVTEFEVDPSHVLVPALAGYGGHLNHRVYAKISRDVGVTAENVGDMESKVIALQPQLVRIFVNNADLIDADRKASFVRTVLLAQKAGATINVTWQGGTLDLKTGTIPRLAAVLNGLVLDEGVTNLRWLTLQNEPNGTALTMQEVENRYRQLDPFIFGIRGQVRFMGGDLVLTNQQAWFDYMASHMADILDAWSVHVFWDYWDTQKLQDRLTGVRAIWDDEPVEERKPLYVMEYGVRGIRTFNGVAQVDPGVWADGTSVTETNINAFQHAWFDILSARLGFLGTVKWDSYFGKYDNGTQAYFMIGPPQAGWPLYPVYHDVQLWTSTVKPGWKVIGLDGSSGAKLLAAYAGAAGDLTVLGLDSDGAQLNDASGEPVSYSIGGLPPRTAFHLVVWNARGDGQNAIEADVVADPAGVATLSVPQQAVFSLTTMPIPAA